MSAALDMSLDDIIARAPTRQGSGGKAQKSAMKAKPSKKPYARPEKPAQGKQGGGGGTSVYVGNLSWNVTWQGLKDHFKQAGNVLHADVMMRQDGKSQGCGLVSFASAKEARRAINTLHDTELDGRLIFVREDREA